MSTYDKKKNVYKKIKLKNREYEWFEVWDALYYYFISKNKIEFSKNYALAAQVKHWKKKSKKEQTDIIALAKSYLNKYL